MKLKLKSRLLVLSAVLLTGCGTPQIKQPEQLPVEKQAEVAGKAVKTLKSTVMAAYSGPDNKIKKKSLIAVKDPDMLRFEIKGFFNEPFFLLTIKGKRVQAYFVQDNAYFEGEVFEEDSPAAVFLKQGGKLKLKGNSTEIIASFVSKDATSGLPASAEFIAGDSKLTLTFTDPENGKELPDTLFILKAPKAARIITQAEFNSYLSRWNSK